MVITWCLSEDQEETILEFESDDASPEKFLFLGIDPDTVIYAQGKKDKKDKNNQSQYVDKAYESIQTEDESE